MSYLGKISAIVSANTGDFSAKLLASGKEVASWAKSLTSAVNSASSKASSSLRGIYTEAQKTERALLAIQAKKISFKGFEGQNLAAAVDRMRSLVSVTKEINEPLARAARSLEKMPVAMQGGFLEAMKVAQQRAELIAIDLNQIAAGKSTLTQTGLEKKFQAIAMRAMQTAEAVERLKAVAEGVDSLATGREVQFRNPEFLAEMARARELQAQAAGTQGGNFGGIVERQRAAMDETAVAFARMQEAQLTVGGDVAGATAAYERQLGVVKDINSELARSIAETEKQATAAQRAEDNEIARLINREKAGMAAEQKRYDAEVKRKEDLAREAELAPYIGRTSNIADYRRGVALEAAMKRQAEEAKSLQETARRDFGTTVGDAFNASQIRGAKAELGALQRILVQVGATTGDAAEKVDAFAMLWRRATSEVGGTTKYAKELQAAATAAANAVQKAVDVKGAKINVAQMVKNVGDIGRMGADKASLAFQQLGFAIDDFMSSTGGIDQRIRAISNNLSQMAYILGGTKGLFVALGVTMASQAALALYKWLNGGVAAEDQANALNSALEKQRRIIDELDASFSRIADSMSGMLFSEGTRRAREFSEEMRKMAREQKESRIALLMVLDPTARRKMAEASGYEAQQKGASDAGQRLSLEDAIRRSKAEARAAAKRAAENQIPFSEATKAVGGFGDGKLNALTDPRMLTALALSSATPYGLPLNPLNRGETLAQTQAAREQLRAAEKLDVDAQIAAIEARQKQLAPMATQDLGLMSTLRGENLNIVLAANEYKNLEAVLESLQRQKFLANNESITSFLENFEAAATAADMAQTLNMQATGGRPSLLRAEADAIGERMKEAQDAIEEAQRAYAENSLDLNGLQEVLKAREAEMKVLRDQQETSAAANQELLLFVEALKKATAGIAQMVAEEAKGAAVRSRRDEAAATAAMNVNGEFGPGGDRRRAGDAARDADFVRQRRIDRERQARRVEDARIAAEQADERARLDFERTPEARAAAGRLKELQAVLNDKNATEEDKAKARREMDDVMRSERERFEASTAGAAARARAEFVNMVDAQGNERFFQEDARRAAAMRGRDVGVREDILAARNAEDALRDIAAARDEGALGGQGPLANQILANAQASEFTRQQMRSAAPAIFEMADAVQNAVLQGPSRQALEMTDVSTMEGSRELNRLLRGDDSSRSANIVELEKQNQKLTELVGVMREVANNLGIVLDL